MKPYNETYSFAKGDSHSIGEKSLSALQKEVERQMDKYGELFGSEFDKDFEMFLKQSSTSSMSSCASQSEKKIYVYVSPNLDENDFRDYLSSILRHEAYHLCPNRPRFIDGLDVSHQINHVLVAEDVHRELIEKGREIVTSGILSDYHRALGEGPDLAHSEISAEFFGSPEPYKKISFFESQEMVSNRLAGFSNTTVRAPYYVGLALRNIADEETVAGWLSDGTFYSEIWDRRDNLTTSFRGLLTTSKEKSNLIAERMINWYP